MKTRIRKLSLEDRDLLLREAGRGARTRDLAARVGVSPRRVREFLRLQGQPQPPYPAPPASESERARIRQLREDGRSVSSIAAELGRSEGLVARVLATHD